MAGRNINRYPCPERRVPAPRRPAVRGECDRIDRPCPFVTCRYHLYSDIVRGALKIHSNDLYNMEYTCALDIADANDGLKLREIADIMGLTRERVRQILVTALRKVRSS